MIGLAGLSLAAAGCGGGSSLSVASLGGTTTTSSGTETNSTSGGLGPATSAGSRSGGQFALSVGGSVGELTKFASCMRRNGVPNFPDPNAQGQISASGIDPGSASFQNAQQACRKQLPKGGQPSPAQQEQARKQALAFSACMRRNGVPNFPDPQFGSNGGAAIRIDPSSGIDPGSPQFQAAQKACQKNLPGKQLTAG